MNAKKATVVFPTDFSPFSVAALPWVKRMAESLNADIHCIYIVEEPHIYSTLDLGPVAMPTVVEMKDSAEAHMKKFLATHLKGVNVTSSVKIGRPSNEIVAYASKHNAHAIVMATHGYTGVKHVLLGSTTEDVLRHAKCPVLSVRAED